MYMFPPFTLLNTVIQKLRATQDGEIIPLIAITAVVPTPNLTVCGPPSHHSILPRSTVVTEFIIDSKSYHLHAWRL